MLIRYTVIKKIIETDNVVSIFLTPQNGSPEQFSPGQHITVEIPQGGDFIRRNYTLSDSPGKSHYRLTVKKEFAGRASGYLHNIKVGEYLVASRTPAGSLTLPLDNQDQPIVLLSAGVGITPMLSILNHMIDHQDTRKVWLLHGAKDERSIIMRNWISSLSDSGLNLEMKIFLSRATSEHSHELYRKGRISMEFIKNNMERHFLYLICGPDDFIKDFTDSLMAWGVAKENIFSESFGTRKSELIHADDISKNKKVVFQKSKKELLWDDKYESLLQFAEHNGIPVAFDCRAGTCLTCQTKLLKGNAQYIFELFYVPGEDSLLPCCSIPASDIVLDL